jgi:hypothetical protein
MPDRGKDRRKDDGLLKHLAFVDQVGEPVRMRFLEELAARRVAFLGKDSVDPIPQAREKLGRHAPLEDDEAVLVELFLFGHAQSFISYDEELSATPQNELVADCRSRSTYLRRLGASSARSMALPIA